MSSLLLRDELSDRDQQIINDWSRIISHFHDHDDYHDNTFPDIPSDFNQFDDVQTNNRDLIEYIEYTAALMIREYPTHSHIDLTFPYFNNIDLHSSQHHSFIEPYFFLCDIFHSYPDLFNPYIFDIINTHPQASVIYKNILNIIIAFENIDLFDIFVENICTHITNHLDDFMWGRIIYGSQKIQTRFLEKYQFRYMDDFEYALTRCSTLNFYYLVMKYPIQFLQLTDEIRFQMNLFKYSSTTICKYRYIYYIIETVMQIQNIDDICYGIEFFGYDEKYVQIIRHMMKYANYDFDSNYREYVEHMREKYYDNYEHFIKLCFPEEIVRELLMIQYEIDEQDSDNMRDDIIDRHNNTDDD